MYRPHQSQLLRREAREHLRRYFAFYNNERPYQAHGGLPPSAAYYASLTEQHAVAKAA